MKILVLILLVFSTQAFALVAKNCNSQEFATLDLAHTTAKSHINKAHQVLQNNDDALITAGLKKYFNVD